MLRTLFFSSCEQNTYLCCQDFLHQHRNIRILIMTRRPPVMRVNRHANAARYKELLPPQQHRLVYGLHNFLMLGIRSSGWKHGQTAKGIVPPKRAALPCPFICAAIAWKPQ
jgi:hypothetical protein